MVTIWFCSANTETKTPFSYIFWYFSLHFESYLNFRINYKIVRDDSMTNTDTKTKTFGGIILSLLQLESRNAIDILRTKEKLKQKMKCYTKI